MSWITHARISNGCGGKVLNVGAQRRDVALLFPWRGEGRLEGVSGEHNDLVRAEPALVGRDHIVRGKVPAMGPPPLVNVTKEVR